MTLGGDAFGGRSEAWAFKKSTAWARGGDTPIPTGLNVEMVAYDRGCKPFTLPLRQWSELLYQRQTWHYSGTANGAGFDFTFVNTLSTQVEPNPFPWLPSAGVPRYVVTSSGNYPASLCSFSTTAIISQTATERRLALNIINAVGTATLVITLDQPAPLGLMEAKDVIMRTAFTSALFKTPAQAPLIPRFVLFPDNSFQLVTNQANGGNQTMIANWQAMERQGAFSEEFVYPGTGSRVRFGSSALWGEDMVRSLRLVWATIKRNAAWSEMEYDGIANPAFVFSVPAYRAELSCARHLGGVERVDVPPLFSIAMLTRDDGSVPSGGRGRIIYPRLPSDVVPSPLPVASCFP